MDRLVVALVVVLILAAILLIAWPAYQSAQHSNARAAAIIAAKNAARVSAPRDTVSAVKPGVSGLPAPRPLAPQEPTPCCVPYTGTCSMGGIPWGVGLPPEYPEPTCANADGAWHEPRKYASTVTPIPSEPCGPGMTSNPYADWQAAHGAPVSIADYLDYPGIPYSGPLGARTNDVHPTAIATPGPGGAPCPNFTGCDGCGDGCGVTYDDLGLPQRWLNAMDAATGIPNGIEPDFYGDHYARGAGQLNEQSHGRVVHMFTPDHDPLVD